VKVGSLFSGVGGLELGLERAGMEVVWQAEADKQARSVLKKHWPNVYQFEDVKDVRDARPVDVICGGFPCQDLSVAGKRKGMAGERSGLWWEFHRIISECKPRWVVVENVPGLLSSNEGKDMLHLVESLEELGYGWAYRIFDSQHFGVAQRRRRVFIVGYLGAPCPPEILLECESVQRDSEAGGRSGQGASQGIRNSAEGGGVSWYERHDQDGRVTDLTGKATQTIGANADNGCDLPLVFDTTQVTSPENGSNPQPGDPCHPIAATAHVPLLTSTPSTFHSIAPTLNSSGAGTSRCGGQGAEPQFYVGPRPRRLTPKECERLQGFPDDWTRYYHDGKEVADSPRYRMMGNAVTVNVSEWIGKQIMEAR